MSVSYASGPRDVLLLEETIGERLRRVTRSFGDREALVVRHQGYRATYRELWDQIDRAARAFMARGVAKGDRVAIWAPNRHEWLVTQFATARIGAILVTVNPAYTATELRHALAKAGVSVLVTARGFRGSDHVAAVERFATTPRTIVLDEGWARFLAGAEHVAGAELAAREATLRAGDPINIQHTSGTTGAPKGATLSHRNILNNGYFLARILRYGDRDRVCVPVPPTTRSGW